MKRSAIKLKSDRAYPFLGIGLVFLSNPKFRYIQRFKRIGFTTISIRFKPLDTQQGDLSFAALCFVVHPQAESLLPNDPPENQKTHL